MTMAKCDSRTDRTLLSSPSPSPSSPVTSSSTTSITTNTTSNTGTSKELTQKEEDAATSSNHIHDRLSSSSTTTPTHITTIATTTTGTPATSRSRSLEGSGRDRRVQWASCKNTRDLGGLPVVGGGRTRSGWLYRSDTLTRLSTDGRTAMMAAGITTIIDLRDEPLRRLDPHPFATTTTTTTTITTATTCTPTTTPTTSAAGTTAIATTGPRLVSRSLLPEEFPLPIALDGGYNHAMDAAIDHIGPILQSIMESNGAVVFHCHSGTGRTGLIAALLLNLAGVDVTTINDDYLMSYEAEATPWSEEEASGQVIPSLFTHLHAAYGGAVHYLKRAGLTTEFIQRLRTRLVVGAGASAGDDDGDDRNKDDHDPTKEHKWKLPP